MRMSQIEQAVTIAAEGSISRAAKKLYLSQPNLSQSLKLLEEELGEALFERTGRGVVLTSFGREFLSLAQPAYRQFQMLNTFCTRMDALAPSVLQVASQYFRFANTVFTDFCRMHQGGDFHFSFIEGSFQEVVELVRSQAVELGLIILSPMQRRLMTAMFHQSNLDYMKIAEEEVAVIVRKGHPLCERGNCVVSAKELWPYPFALYRDAQYSMAPEWELLGLHDMPQKITVGDRATLYELLGSTDAFTIGVHNRAAYTHTEYYADKCALHFSGDHPMWLEIGILTGKSRPLSRLAAGYRDRIRQIVGQWEGRGQEENRREDHRRQSRFQPYNPPG